MGKRSGPPRAALGASLREWVKMRHPGIEPGPPRWQRGIITTRLMTHCTGGPHRGVRFESPRPGPPDRIPPDQGSGCPAHAKKRSPVVTAHRTDLPGYGPAVLPLSTAGAFPCSVAGLRRFTPHYQPRGPRLRASPAVDHRFGSGRP